MGGFSSGVFVFEAPVLHVSEICFMELTSRVRCDAAPGVVEPAAEVVLESLLLLPVI